MSTGIKIVFGGAPIGNPPARYSNLEAGYDTVERANHALKVLKDLGVHNIDTAQLYGESEQTIGRLDRRKEFVIDTKTPGGLRPGRSSKEAILEDARASLNDRLKIDQIDIFYVHAPDDSVPIEDLLEGINNAHKEGIFRRFGLSNFKAEDVEKIYNLAKDKGYVLPTVYQGNYSPVARRQESVLFPTLRKLGISFYAYSPLAGGFLTKTREDITNQVGRFDPSRPIGQMYIKLYTKPSYLEALDKWAEAADDEGVSKAELAYRWVSHNSPLKDSYGDAIIIGGRTVDQVTDTVNAIKKGPLSEKAIKAINDIWETIEHDAPLDNYHY